MATRPVVPRFGVEAVLPKAQRPPSFRTTDRIIAIGASTGGTEAIKEVLMHLPADWPGVVIAQHIPKAFSTPFAQRMDRMCQMTVYEAEDGQQIRPGHVYIAPGDRHLMVVRDGARYVCRLDDGSPVNRHKPSVDVLFRSVAQQAGRNAIGVILTGMGKDGAAGAEGDARGRQPDDRAGRGDQRRVGHARRGGAIGGAAEVLPLEAISGRVARLAAAD